MMDAILQGIPHVICYIDDILITGFSDDVHLTNLEEVFSRLNQQGIKLQKEKCVFFQSTVEYLGHIVDKEGIHTAPSKVEVIQLAPKPKNIKKLHCFLGLATYYRKFVPNLSSLVQPLNLLLRKGAEWMWSRD